MKLTDAASKGITRVRRPVWADETAYLKLDILSDGGMGPWVHLYEPDAQAAIGVKTPQDILAIDDKTDDYVEYTGNIYPETTKPPEGGPE